MSKKEKSYDQAAAMQEKAVRFLRDVVGDDEKADEIESLSVYDYAERKGLMLANPVSESETISPRSKHMAEDNDPRTKAEIKDSEENALSVLDDVWNEGIIANDNDSLSAEDALDVIAEILNDFDPVRFPMDDDEEEIEDEAA